MARIGQLHGTYDFNKVDLIFGTRALTGFENGTAITAERAEQSFTKKVDIDGSVTRSRSNDKTGTVTFSLSQFSEDNAYLQSILNLDERTGTGVFPLKIVDKSNPNNELAVSLETWIQKPATRTFEMESTAREWVLENADLDFL